MKKKTTAKLKLRRLRAQVARLKEANEKSEAALAAERKSRISLAEEWEKAFAPKVAIKAVPPVAKPKGKLVAIIAAKRT